MLSMSLFRPGCSCPRGFQRPPRPGADRHVLPWQPKRILTGTVPCTLNSALLGDHCPAVGSAPGASWDLTLNLTLPLNGTFSQNLSLPRSLTLQLSRLLAWALISALEGDHETGVASALTTSPDRTLILAKAVSPWDQIPTSDNTTRLGSRSGAW